MTTTNIDRLKLFVDLMNAGQFNDARQMISEKIVVREAKAIPYGGDFSGLDGFDRFRAIFGKTWKRWIDGPIWYAEADGTVAKYNTITAISRATGREYTSRLVELFTFDDGLITEAVVFYQDIPEFLEAVNNEAPA